MRKVLGTLIVASALLVSACNTVKGAGRDAASVGDAVANTVDEVK